MARPARGLLIGVATLAPVLVAMFGADYLTDVQDEMAWRDRRGPFDYIERGQGGRYLPQAQLELEREQRQIGLITRLFRDSGRLQILQAAFSRNGEELVAASNVAIGRWDASSSTPRPSSLRTTTRRPHAREQRSTRCATSLRH